MHFDTLTPEQKAKAQACTTPAEMLALAQEEGLELSEEELEQVSGGDSWDCPFDGCSQFLSTLPD